MGENGQTVNLGLLPAGPGTCVRGGSRRGRKGLALCLLDFFYGTPRSWEEPFQNLSPKTACAHVIGNSGCLAVQLQAAAGTVERQGSWRAG